LDFTVINLQEAGMSAELEYCSLYIKLLKKPSANLITNHQRWLFENGREDVVEALCEWVCDKAEFEMVTSETAQGLFNSFPQSVKNYNRNCNQKQQQSVTTHFDQHMSKLPSSTEKEKPSCSYCGQPHEVWNCESFKSIRCEQRWQEAKDESVTCCQVLPLYTLWK
jgi:hypothetical protein